MIAIPMLSININKLIDLNFKIENDTAHERIALFCKKYKQHISISYKVTKAETGKLRDLSIGIAELDILFEKYFQCNEWWAKNKGISNFVKHLNEVRILAAGITAGKYPNEWDLQFNNKLAPAAAQEYWKHLRSLGWNPVKRGGQVIKWEKK